MVNRFLLLSSFSVAYRKGRKLMKNIRLYFSETNISSTLEYVDTYYAPAYNRTHSHVDAYTLPTPSLLLILLYYASLAYPMDYGLPVYNTIQYSASIVRYEWCTRSQYLWTQFVPGTVSRKRYSYLSFHTYLQSSDSYLSIPTYLKSFDQSRLHMDIPIISLA